LPVRAGLQGKYKGYFDDAFSPGYASVVTDDGYTILYAHINKPADLSLKADAKVTPDTILGTVDPKRQHLHLEVRYFDENFIKRSWIMSFISQASTKNILF